MTSITNFPELTDVLKKYLYPLKMIDQTPKLVFKKIETDSLALSFHHNPYTQNNRKAIALVEKWCTENACGMVDMYQELVIFRSEEEMVWFTLVWS